MKKSAIINRVEFIINYQGNYGGLTLKTIKLQLSNDGENFIDASTTASFSNNIAYTRQWNTLQSTDTTNEYRFVRLYASGYYSSSYGQGICLKEVQIYGSYDE